MTRNDEKIKQRKTTRQQNKLEYMKNINKQNDNKETAVFIAARRGDVNVVNLLIQYGADIKIRDINGQSPLHAAVWSGSTETIHLLLDAKACVDDIDNFNNTPLSIAVYKENKTIILMLLAAGAKANPRLNISRVLHLRELGTAVTKMFRRNRCV